MQLEPTKNLIAKIKRNNRLITDISIISVLTIFLTLIYPNATPSITRDSDLSYEFKEEKIRDTQYATEVLISATFKNKYIKNGFINSVIIEPQFKNPDISGNDAYIEYHIKYVDKLNIGFLRKKTIRTSISLFYKSPTYLKDKEFTITFFDNYNKLIEFGKGNEPAIIKFQ